MVAAVAVAGVALATIPNEGVISACYQSGGILRVIDVATGATCAKTRPPSPGTSKARRGRKAPREWQARRARKAPPEPRARPVRPAR